MKKRRSMSLHDIKCTKNNALLICLCIMITLFISGCAFGLSENKVTETPIEIIREVEVERIVEVPVEIDKIVEVEKEVGVFDYSLVPQYNNVPYVEINDGYPYFGNEILLTVNGEFYSELDVLGRCGVAIALLGENTMPQESRGQIGNVRPSGWQITKYDGIDGNYLYNRCHLIGWQLSGENDNTRNLITGTRYMNIQGMEPFEEEVVSYIRETGNHVLYRATPVFIGEELVARGVLLEAQSIEDDTLRFNVFCYNVQPDVEINYMTGESKSTRLEVADETEEMQTFSLEEFGGTVSNTEGVIDRSNPSDNTAVTIVEPSQEELIAPVEAYEQAQPASESSSESYIGNQNTKKFHYPWCASVNRMADHNKVMFSGVSRDEIIGRGYVPCKNCNP